MMRMYILLSFLLLSVHLRVEAKMMFPEEWHLWKSEHQKLYKSEKEEIQRHLIWLSNKRYIEAFNSYNHTFGYTLGMNELGDLTEEEFVKQYKCIRHPSESLKMSQNYTLYSPPSSVSLPEVVDWVGEGVVTSVKKQGGCCSCYAFAAVGTIEGVHALTSGKLISLSTQNIIDCSTLYGNHGCEMGSIEIAFQYAIDMGGVDTEQSYPYEGAQRKCRFKENKIGASIRYIIKVQEGVEKDLQAAIALEGPVAVAVDGNHNTFRFYQRGIYDEPNCSRSKLTHAMLAVGYGSYNGKDYWLVKNSWGTKWGQSGYIMMARNKSNQCGIATSALIPTL